MAIPQRDTPDIELSEQRALNRSFDKKYDVLAVELMSENSAGTALERVRTALIPSVDYDYMDVVQTSSTVTTYVYKSGGSGGTTVQTVAITYTDSTKSTESNISWS